MKNNWLRNTNQVWKISIFYVLLGISLILFGLLIFSINYLKNVEEQFLIASTFTFSGILAFLWLIFSIRCPDCHKRIAYFFIFREKATLWFKKLNDLEFCPFCKGKK